MTFSMSIASLSFVEWTAKSARWTLTIYQLMRGKTHTLARVVLYAEIGRCLCIGVLVEHGEGSGKAHGSKAVI